MHVTLRVSDALSGVNLRCSDLYAVVWRALVASCLKPGFRVVHYSVQRNHVHLIVEADRSERLSRGIQGLKIRLARQLNSRMRRSGPFWGERYHAHLLRTPTEVRRALRYVLLNTRKHARRGAAAPLTTPKLDALSSATWFNGWLDLGPTREPELPTAQSFLLSRGWLEAGGAIDPTGVPGRGPP